MKGLKKCAILLGIIKEVNANIIISYLSKNEKEKIIQEIEKKEKITKKEKNKVLLEFFDFFRKQKKPIISLNIINLCLILFFIFIFITLYFFDDSKRKLEEIIVLGNNMGIIYFFLYPYISYFVRYYYGKTPIKLAFNSKKPGIDIIIGFICGIILCYLLILINEIIKTKPIVLSGIFYILLITQGLLGPIIEEIFFRKFIYTKLTINLNKILAIIFTSIFFSLVHLPSDITVGFLYFLSSIILTVVYELRKSILPCIISHSLGNILFYLY